MDREEELRKKRAELRKQGVKRLRPEGDPAHQVPTDFDEFGEKGISSASGAKIIAGIMMGLIILLFGLWAFIHFFGEGKEAESPLTSSVARPNFVERSDPASVELSIDAAVRGFMTAGTLEERSQFVIGGAGVLPLMESYYQRSEAVLPNGCQEIPDQMSSVQKGAFLMAARAIDLGGQSIWFSLVSGHDRVMIDWESTVGYGEMPWTDFVNERPLQEVLMRVYLLRFIDEEDRDLSDPPYFYRVNGKNKSSSVVAAPVRGSEVERDLASLVPARESHPVTVRMRFNDGQPFAEVTEVIHDLWVDLERVEASRKID